jgi:putative hydrolase of the HAD superfamily
MATRVVLFDLGGVLVELSGLAAMRAWAGEARDEDVWRRWLACPWVRRFERGQCSPEEFAAGVVLEWRLPVSPTQYLESFRVWPRGLLPGARELVEAIAPGLRRACLSNSNDLHWPRKRDEMGLGALLDEHFVSHRIGHVKPDPEIYEHVIAALGVDPAEILFLDDNQPNVDGALEAGLDAVRAVGVEGARRVLEARGLLAARGAGCSRPLSGAGAPSDRSRGRRLSRG